MNRSNRWRILLAAALSVVALYLVWDYRTEDVADRATPQPGETAPPSFDPNRPTSLTSVPESDAPGRRALVPTAGPGETCLRVVRADARTPAPDAELFLLPRARFEERWSSPSSSGGTPDVEAFLVETGDRLALDADATVCVPTPTEPFVVMARTAGEWVLEEVGDPTVTELLVTLAPAPPLRVRVVDAAGEPVGGVPVALRCKEDFHTHDLRLASSAADTGLAEIPRVVAAVATHGEGGDEGEEGAFVAALAICSPAPIEAVIDPHALPGAPLELSLPATGALEVRLRGGEGGPEDRAVVSLRPADAGSVGAGAALIRAEVLLGDPVARFEHVALGLEIDLLVWSDAYLPVNARVRGPRAAGELAVVEVTLGEKRRVIRGRLVDGNGIAPPATDFRIWLPQVPWAQPLPLDEDGTFRFPVTGPEPVESQILTIAAGEPGTRDAVGGRWALPAPTAAGDFDLGRLVITSARLQAAGVVRDADGAPFVGARVWLERRASNLERWSNFAGEVSETDAGGSFALHDFDAPGELRVVAAHDSSAAPAVADIAPGAEDVVLVLSRANEVRVRLLLDDFVRPESVALSLLAVPREGETEDEAEARAPGTLLQLDDGSYSFPAVRPGVYTLNVALGEDGEWVTEVPDVVVAGDVELADVDLRGRIRSVTIDVRDATGQPVRDAYLDRRVPGESEFGTGWTRLPRGQGRLLTVAEKLDLRVWAQGLRAKVVEGVGPEVKVTLEPGIPRRLRLENAPPLPEDHAFQVLVGREGEGHAAPIDFDVASETLVRVSDEGEYVLALSVRRADGESALVWRTDLQVVEGDDELVPLTLPPGAVEEALARLGR